MERKKNSKIIIIAIIILAILILLTGAAYTYFATDIFKSNKDLFFKYITQIGNEKEGFIEKSLKEYFEKQKNTPYSDEGGVSINIVASNDKEQFENTNNMNITFNGQVDKTNSQVTQNISLNYSDTVNFPLSYKQIGNTKGIQTDYVGSKYVATNSNLTENVEGLKKVQELKNVQFNEENLQHIKDTYLDILNQELKDSNFSKIENSSSKGYKLTLNGEELKNIIIKLLETLRNDSSTLDKINEYIKIQKNSLKITTTDIDNAIKDINSNTELNDESLEIIVYQTKGKVSSVLAKMKKTELKLEKTITENDLQYNIEIQMNYDNLIGKIGLVAKFAGLQSMQNITENHQLTLEIEEIKYQYNYNNNVEFVDNANIEEFSNVNSLILDEMDEGTRNNLIDAIKERLQNVSNSQMEELGLEKNENPLQYVLPQFETYFSALNIKNLSEEDVTNFNRKFENYESTNLQGVTVKGLLSTIQLNNESQEDNNKKIKEIHFDGEEYEVTDQNIILLKSSVETETAYRVSFEKDEDTGIIYRTVINKK